MMSEIAEGNWIDAFQGKHMDKYSAPTLEGVDYPNLGVSTAWNDTENGVLHVGTYVGDRNAAGRATSLRITKLPNASEAVVIKNGSAVNGIQVVDANTIRFDTEIGDHQYQIRTGYFGQGVVMNPPDPLTAGSASFVAATKRTAEQNAKAAESVMLSGGGGCPCCGGSA